MSSTLLGPVRDVHSTEDSVIVSLEAGRVHVTSPHDSVLRLRCVPPGKHRPNLSVAVLESPPRPLTLLDPSVVEAEGITVSFQPDGSAVVAGRASDDHLVNLFTLAGLEAIGTDGLRATLRVGPHDPFFGLGEHTGPMNRRERKCTNWNTDTAPHTPSYKPLYSSFPMFVSRCEGGAWYGVFVDNPARSRFDMGHTHPEQAIVEVEAGDLDLYVLAGPTPRDVVHRYGRLTGTMEMLPKWILGYQQSRWSYFPASRVLDLAREFRRLRFPCDVIYLDIDYMDRYRAFTWHPEHFPEPQRLIDELHGMGFKVIPILNSAVAADDEFPTYREGRERGLMLKTKDGEVYQAAMWPGHSAFPDFTLDEARAWWADLHEDLLALGVDGVWNDMNEPTVFKEPPKTFPEDLPHSGGRPHLEVHNAYANLMNMATHAGVAKFRPGERLPIMTRAAYAGVQRDAFKWTGDNSSWWEHMPMAIAMVSNLGLCGLPFTGPDIGGFNDECTAELFLRWVQMGVFFPYVRAHTCQGTRDQEPWSFGPEVLEVSRRFVELRYRLLPYVYSLLAEAARHGEPMLRPLFYQYPQDARAVVADDQFLLGPDLLVAPIMTPGKYYRAVYLPPGAWFSYFGETEHEGGNVEIAEVPLDHIPVYVRANAIIPMGPVGQYVGEKPLDRIEWHVWAGRGAGAGWMYEDDGRTNPEARAGADYAETHVRGEFHASLVRLSFEARRGTYAPPSRTFEIVLHGRLRAPKSCNVPGVRYEMGLARVAFVDTGEAREIVLEW